MEIFPQPPLRQEWSWYVQYYEYDAEEWAYFYPVFDSGYNAYQWGIHGEPENRLPMSYRIIGKCSGHTTLFMSATRANYLFYRRVSEAPLGWQQNGF